jgi:hypothetical protein
LASLADASLAIRALAQLLVTTSAGLSLFLFAEASTQRASDEGRERRLAMRGGEPAIDISRSQGKAI